MQDCPDLRKTGEGLDKRQVADLVAVCKNVLEIAHGLVAVQPKYEANFFIQFWLYSKIQDTSGSLIHLDETCQGKAR